MKRRTLLAPLALALAVGACDDMLTEEPRSFLTIENFYRSTEDARAAVLAAYSSFSALNVADWRWYFIGEAMSDVANAHPLDQNVPAQSPGTLTWDANNVFMVQHWTSTYNALYRVNLALERLPQSPMPAAEQEVAIGELKFIRGWFYLEAEKRYAGVPIVTSTEDHANPTPTRATREEVDAQIIQDLTEAEAVLPLSWPAAQWGRATKGAARMALADLYIWRSSRYNTGEWQQASDWAKRIIDSGEYRLLEDQLDVFLPDNKGNDEVIFARVNLGTQNRNGSSVQAAHYPRELTPGGGFAVVTPTPWSWESFEDGDYRVETSFRFSACNLTGTRCFDPLPFPHPYKYRPSDQTGNQRGDTDDIFYRYAETLLYYAEAQNELGNTDEAIRYVNMIRERARGGVGGAENRPVPADYPMGMSQVAARDAIFWERHYELIWEVKRWWDLVRRDTLEPGYLVAQLQAHDPLSHSQGPFQEFRKLWAIPQREITVTRGSLEQNPGYN